MSRWEGCFSPGTWLWLLVASCLPLLYSLSFPLGHLRTPSNTCRSPALEPPHFLTFSRLPCPQPSAHHPSANSALSRKCPQRARQPIVPRTPDTPLPPQPPLPPRLASPSVATHLDLIVWRPRMFSAPLCDPKAKQPPASPLQPRCLAYTLEVILVVAQDR